MQDTYSQKMFGAAEVKYGLYMLTEPLVSLSQIPTSICNNVVTLTDTNKHCRQGLMLSCLRDCYGYPKEKKVIV